MGTKSKPVRRSRALLDEWRAVLPYYRRLVEEQVPHALATAAEQRREDVPDSWKQMVATMQKQVYEDVDRNSDHPSEETLQERRGYYWHFAVSHVADMVEYLMGVIRRDIFVDNKGTIASMQLVRMALMQLSIELEEGGTKEGRGDGREMQYRVMQALLALSPQFDDVSLRRLRALQVAESSAKAIHPPLTEEEVEAKIDCLRESMQQDEDWTEAHRQYLQVELPPFDGVLALSKLTEVDERFAVLDPLEVMEEFSDAETENRGGRTDEGEGRVGPARALARLAVRCGALGYEQGEGETFDAAVERARTNLHVTLSRIRKTMNAYPVKRLPAEEDNA